MITPVPMSGRARGAWPLSHPPSLLSAPNLVLSEHAFPAEIAQLSDGGNNMIYGTHKIRMNSACMCNSLYARGRARVQSRGRGRGGRNGGRTDAKAVCGAARVSCDRASDCRS